MVKRILYFLILPLSMACSEPIDAIDPVNYFPLEDGMVWEYEVFDTQYSLTEQPKVNHYFLKERLAKISDKSYKIERFTQQNKADEWTFSAVGAYTLNGNKILRNDEGLDLLLFYQNPTDKLSWNQNLHNTLDEVTLITSDLGKAFNSYANTLQVVQKKDSSLISKDYIYTVYAANTGLIYKEITDIEFCQTSSDCIGSGAIDSGKSYKAVIINSYIE